MEWRSRFEYDSLRMQFTWDKMILKVFLSDPIGSMGSSKFINISPIAVGNRSD